MLNGSRETSLTLLDNVAAPSLLRDTERPCRSDTALAEAGEVASLVVGTSGAHVVSIFSASRNGLADHVSTEIEASEPASSSMLQTEVSFQLTAKERSTPTLNGFKQSSRALEEPIRQLIEQVRRSRLVMSRSRRNRGNDLSH